MSFFLLRRQFHHHSLSKILVDQAKGPRNRDPTKGKIKKKVEFYNLLIPFFTYLFCRRLLLLLFFLILLFFFFFLLLVLFLVLLVLVPPLIFLILLLIFFFFCYTTQSKIPWNLSFSKNLHFSLS